MPLPTLLTEHRKKQLKKEERIFKLYQQLVSQPGAMPTAVEQHIMKEFGIKNRSTIFASNRRYLARLEEQQTQQELSFSAGALTTSLDSINHTKALI